MEYWSRTTPPPSGPVTRGSNASMNRLEKAGEENVFFSLLSFPIPSFSQFIRPEAPTCNRPAQRNQTASDRNPGGFSQPPSYYNFSRSYSTVSGVWCEHCGRISLHPMIVSGKGMPRLLVAVPIPDSAKMGTYRAFSATPNQPKPAD